MDVSEAFQLISRAIDAGRPAHGYLIVGGVGGTCAELTGLILEKLFPEAIEQVRAGSHPDICWLRPSGKSRTIKVQKTDTDPSPGMRDAIVEPMSTTAFSGGWKVGVIEGADRLQPAAANAFLKSLEEPTPKTMYLLITDQPDAILPTIVSRTQRIDLPLPSGILEGEDYEDVADAFAARDSQRLADKLKALKEDAEDEDAALVRKAFYKTLLSFCRAMLLGGKLPRHQAFRNLEAVEEAYRRSEKALNDDAVLAYLMDLIVFPTSDLRS